MDLGECLDDGMLGVEVTEGGSCVWLTDVGRRS